MSAIVAAPVSPQRITAADARIQDLVEVLEQQTHLERLSPRLEPFATSVLVYDAKALRGLDDDETVTLETELVRALRTGPGIVVFTGRLRGHGRRPQARIRRSSPRQRAEGGTAGDHFAKPGANDRVWSALEKLAVGDPEVFVAYYANDILALVSRGLARARVPGHLAGQRRQPRRGRADGPPRLPPRLPGPRRWRGVPAPMSTGCRPR